VEYGLAFFITRAIETKMASPAVLCGSSKEELCHAYGMQMMGKSILK
jgi:hypothetical protein